MFRVVPLLAALLLLAACSEPEPGLERGLALFDTCVPCHGADGSGSVALAAPSIAGLERWYAVEQLTKFRAGDRGYHPDDMEGARMRPMARTLVTDEDVDSVARYVASLPPVVSPDTLIGGDAAAGQAKYAVCTACHGPDGEGNEALGAPSLVGQDDWYLLGQLDKFVSGQRGTDPDDARGAQMRPMALTLTDQQARLDVVTYVRSLQ
jgi:cytochrome c553